MAKEVYLNDQPGKIIVMRLAALVSIIVATTVLSACGSSQRTLTPGKAEIVSATDLRSFARSSSFPIYWAGKIQNYKTELTETGDGQVFVRYLPPKVTAGDFRQNFLTVASYPQAGAWSILKSQKKNKGAKLESIPGGGIMLWYKNRKTSAYLAWPGSTTLVELYWPYGPQNIAKQGQIGQVR